MAVGVMLLLLLLDPVGNRIELPIRPRFAYLLDRYSNCRSRPPSPLVATARSDGHQVFSPWQEATPPLISSHLFNWIQYTRALWSSGVDKTRVSFTLKL